MTFPGDCLLLTCWYSNRIYWWRAARAWRSLAATLRRCWFDYDCATITWFTIALLIPVTVLFDPTLYGSIVEDDPGLNTSGLVIFFLGSVEPMVLHCWLFSAVVHHLIARLPTVVIADWFYDAAYTPVPERLTRCAALCSCITVLLPHLLFPDCCIGCWTLYLVGDLRALLI